MLWTIKYAEFIGQVKNENAHFEFQQKHFQVIIDS